MSINNSNFNLDWRKTRIIDWKTIKKEGKCSNTPKLTEQDHRKREIWWGIEDHQERKRIEKETDLPW